MNRIKIKTVKIPLIKKVAEMPSQKKIFYNYY